jgi:hypothetical protein
MSLPTDDVAVEVMAKAVYERLNPPRDCGGKLSNPVWGKDYPGLAYTFRLNQAAAWEALKPMLLAGRTPHEQRLINYIDSAVEMEVLDNFCLPEVCPEKCPAHGGPYNELKKLMLKVFPEETR